MRRYEKDINHILSYEIEYLCPHCKLGIPGLPSRGIICAGCRKSMLREEILQKITEIIVKAKQVTRYER